MKAKFLALFFLLCATIPKEGLAQIDLKTLKASESDLNFSVQSNFLRGSGRLTKYSGSLRVNSHDFSQSVISFDFDPATCEFDSGAAFLQALVQQLPPQPINFKSTTMRATSSGGYRVNGKVTSRGKTKTVAFPITVKRSAKGDTIIEGEVDSSELDFNLPPALQDQALVGSLTYKLVFR